MMRSSSAGPRGGWLRSCSIAARTVHRLALERRTFLAVIVGADLVGAEIESQVANRAVDRGLAALELCELGGRADGAVHWLQSRPPERIQDCRDNSGDQQGSDNDLHGGYRLRLGRLSMDGLGGRAGVARAPRWKRRAQ